jgi:hypothetical protein
MVQDSKPGDMVWTCITSLKKMNVEMPGNIQRWIQGELKERVDDKSTTMSKWSVTFDAIGGKEVVISKQQFRHNHPDEEPRRVRTSSGASASGPHSPAQPEEPMFSKGEVISCPKCKKWMKAPAKAAGLNCANPDCRGRIWPDSAARALSTKELTGGSINGKKAAVKKPAAPDKSGKRGRQPVPPCCLGY